MPLTEHEWIDAATGLTCRRRECRQSHYCGYVRVPAGSFLDGLGYDDEDARLAAALEERKRKPLGDCPGLAVMIAGLLGEDLKPSLDRVINVHGGVTFADRFDDREGWWIGFDCAHAGDQTHYMPGRSSGGVWRDEAFVEAECAKLAAQVADLAGATPTVVVGAR